MAETENEIPKEAVAAAKQFQLIVDELALKLPTVEQGKGSKSAPKDPGTPSGMESPGSSIKRA